MKKLIYLIVLVFIITACEDRDHPKPDYIVYTEINDTVNVSESDTLYNDLIFNISNDSDGLHAYIINFDYTDMLGVFYYSFLIVDDKDAILILNKNDTINSSKEWKTGVKKLYLDQFAGKGEKYIGYCDRTDVPQYCYGWIKISLSTDKKTLLIISRAINKAKENAILAGQME